MIVTEIKIAIGRQKRDRQKETFEADNPKYIKV